MSILAIRDVLIMIDGNAECKRLRSVDFNSIFVGLPVLCVTIAPRMIRKLLIVAIVAGLVGCRIFLLLRPPMLDCLSVMLNIRRIYFVNCELASSMLECG